MNSNHSILNENSLIRFDQLYDEAIDNVLKRLNYECPTIFEEKNNNTCREDIAYHLRYLRPTLESGCLSSYIEYLQWLNEVFLIRNIPTSHINDALHWLGKFFSEKMNKDGEIIQNQINTAISDAKKTKPLAAITSKAWPEQQAFESSLLQGDHKSASLIIDEALKKGFNLIEIEVLLIEPAMYEIGCMWQQNQVSIAQEHLATATALTLMAHYFTQASLKPLNGKKAILACVETNEHMLGLNMISDALQMNGWEVQFLGANTPTKSFVEHVIQNKTNIVGLSISFSYQLMAAREIIQSLREAFPTNCPKLVIGGNAVNRYPEMFKSIGADLSIKDALSVTKQLAQ